MPIITKEQKREKYEQSVAYKTIFEINFQKERRLKIRKLMKHNNINKAQASKLWQDRKDAETSKNIEKDVANASTKQNA